MRASYVRYLPRTFHFQKKNQVISISVTGLVLQLSPQIESFLGSAYGPVVLAYIGGWVGWQSLSSVSVTSIIDGLKKLYIEKLKPLEVTYRFNDFVSPTLVLSYHFPLSALVQILMKNFYKRGMPDVNLLVDVVIARIMQTESDFDAKPQVMLLGQYSTGKTTFIKHLLRTSYPGAHIGPEPTTDRFVVVMVGASSLQKSA